MVHSAASENFANDQFMRSQFVADDHSMQHDKRAYCQSRVDAVVQVQKAEVDHDRSSTMTPATVAAVPTAKLFERNEQEVVMEFRPAAEISALAATDTAVAATEEAFPTKIATIDSFIRFIWALFSKIHILPRPPKREYGEISQSVVWQ